MNLLLACTGSVASIKLVGLVKNIKERVKNATITIVLTDCALYFITEDDRSYLNSEKVAIYTNKDEWKDWVKVGDPILHIDLVKWADMMLIAPLDANTMAKLAGGICDNLLTCICRAWNFDKPLLFAPAMNTVMWNHPLTRQHTDLLLSWKYKIVPPIEKRLACGDTGTGAMEEVSKIVDTLIPYLKG